ncbi:sensor histidine kinase [Anaerosacchariphilus polymeriproducens]|uniref:histidine kinase n=1 Tax=Anaerosacchariphilus polymeriproducens TaxID=1812858 RepID=A0A371ARD7_9FIRM|nr:HAMP domain-containing sensor histidine kinase [Anaerosacchariphilus polymeriproducens]RDU22010.1 sensor histidine kinase [Anaerosacchariphilus polymeriproducens]
MKNKNFSLKSKLSLSISLVVLLIVALISLLANYFIEDQFKDYILIQQKKTTHQIITSISQQYNNQSDSWDIDFIHKIGMDALYNGYIISVYDSKNNTVWDAKSCDMELCNEIMNDISDRMMVKYPSINGTFITNEYPAINNKQQVGTVKISNFGPYFLSKDDFQFLDSLNQLLIGIGIFSLAVSILVGFYLAKKLTNPISKTVEVSKRISFGDYGARIQEETNTKEIDELILSINHMAETLENQENLRKQLTADVAHELRTPLTTVQTHMEALIEGIWEPTTKRLQSCYDEITRICKLVNDLERLAKLEGQNLNLKKTSINLLELTNKVIYNFEVELKNKYLKINVSGNCQDIPADEDRINQVLTNLISNAVKYTPYEGSIEINLSETETSALLSISDNGIGIPESELPYIFERFYRADKSRNRMTGGSGIGLAIVKSIITAHRGSIEVTSNLNEGSCFTIILPKYRNQ